MTDAVTGLFEIHVFVAPLDPDDAAVARFRAACQSASPPMKPLLLALDYVHKGFVAVLQSSRYIEGDERAAREAAARDAEVLRAAGLSVLREKVEAVAGDPGVPQSAADGARAPADRYFEFHLLVDRASGGLTEADMRALRGVAGEFAARRRRARGVHGDGGATRAFERRAVRAGIAAQSACEPPIAARCARRSS